MTPGGRNREYLGQNGRRDIVLRGDIADRMDGKRPLRMLRKRWEDIGGFLGVAHRNHDRILCRGSGAGNRNVTHGLRMSEILHDAVCRYSVGRVAMPVPEW